MRLIIEVLEIEGTCPVYKIGDKIVLDEGYRLNLEETDNMCLHSMASVIPYHAALAKGINPVELGLAKTGGAAYVQCLDPQRYTGGGTVTFKITRE